MRSMLNQYYIQLQKYYGDHNVVDQNENQLNQLHTRQELEKISRTFIIGNGSKNGSEMTRRKKYIRTMRRIQK